MGRQIQTSHGIFEEVDATQLQQDNQLANMASAGPGAFARSTNGINEQTIAAIQGTREAFDQFQRDQGYIGNNAQNVGYLLENDAKYITSRMTPLVDMTPRVEMAGIDKTNYRTVLDLFGGNGPSISSGIIDQGGTPNKVAYQWKDLSYTAKMMAIADAVTFETQIYGRSFQGDPLALASAKLIPALKQIQEYNYINWGVKCWNPAPPSAISTSTTGGLLTAGTYWIIVTAVNAQGETLAYGGAAPVAATIPTTGTTSTITFNIFTVPGAVSYRVYVGIGATQPATSAMWLQSATTQFGNAAALNQPTTGVRQGFFTVTMGAAAVATSGTAYSTTVGLGNTAQMLPGSTYAGNTGAPLTFDGMIALILQNAGVSGNFGTQGETPLVYQPAAANGSVALTDIDNLHYNGFLNAQADYDYMFVGVADHKTISARVANGTNARVLLNADNADAQRNLVAGYRATAYINQTTGKVIPIKMLPYLTQGTIIFGSYELPTTLQGIDLQPFRVGYNRAMWSQVYPPDQSHPTQTLVAAYTNECIINQYLGGWAALTGVSLT